MTVEFFHDRSPLKHGTGSGSNSRPLDLQSDSHLLPDTLRIALCSPVGPNGSHKVIVIHYYKIYNRDNREEFWLKREIPLSNLGTENVQGLGSSSFKAHIGYKQLQ